MFAQTHGIVLKIRSLRAYVKKNVHPIDSITLKMNTGARKLRVQALEYEDQLNVLAAQVDDAQFDRWFDAARDEMIHEFRASPAYTGTARDHQVGAEPSCMWLA